MVQDKRIENNKARNEELLEGEEKGIITGIRYWETNRSIYTMINKAAKEKEVTAKMKILSESQGQLPHLYDFIKNSPHSEELKSQQEGLENLAIGHGFVMTEKGVYLDNKKYNTQ